MILSPLNIIYANVKSAGSGRGKTPWLNGRAVARPVRPFWPVRKNAGQCGQTRSVGGMAGKRTCAVSTFARAAGHGLNVDRSECRPPKMAVCGRHADPSDTANYRLAV